MSDIAPKFRPMILEAIEGLRIRKTRPDGPRIVSYCSKKFGLRPTEVKLDLERLVDEDAVLKVDYKGSVSFRDSEKWIHADATNGMLHYKGPTDESSIVPLAVQFGHVQNSTITTERIIAAVQALSDAQTAGSTSRKAATVGVPISLEAIESHIGNLYPGTKLQNEHLTKCIFREVDCGRLVQLMNGSFVLADRVDRTMKIKREAILAPPQPKKIPDKKKKKHRLSKLKVELFDDEAQPEWTPKQKRLKKFSKIGNAKLDQAMRKKSGRHCLECAEEWGLPAARTGVLLECTNCNYATHPGCGGYSEETVAALEGNYKCMQCKRCKICNTGKLVEDQNLVVCVRCDNSFHLSCHTPPVSLDQAATEWRCADCKVAQRFVGRKQSRLNNGKLKPATLHLIKRRKKKGTLSGGDTDNGDWKDFNGVGDIGMEKVISFGGLSKADVVVRAVESYYDSLPPKKTPELVHQIAAWSVEEVAQKFADRGFANFAESVRVQSIDGAALMLLTRDDVVTRFGLALVPALKFYREICTLCPFGPYTDWN